MGPKKKKKFFQTWFCCQVSTLLGLCLRRSGRDYRRTFIILWGLFSCRIDQLVEALTCTHLHWDHTSATQETAQLLSSLCLTPLSTIQQLCNGREREKIKKERRRDYTAVQAGQIFQGLIKTDTFSFKILRIGNQEYSSNLTISIYYSLCTYSPKRPWGKKAMHWNAREKVYLKMPAFCTLHAPFQNPFKWLRRQKKTNGPLSISKGLLSEMDPPYYCMAFFLTPKLMMLLSPFVYTVSFRWWTVVFNDGGKNNKRHLLCCPQVESRTPIVSQVILESSV